MSSSSEVGLSRREREIVELLREHLTNKEIAQRLNLSEQTVKNHVHHILQKSGAPDRFRIVEFCQKKRQGVELNDAPGTALRVVRRNKSRRAKSTAVASLPNARHVTPVAWIASNDMSDTHEMGESTQ